MARDAAILTARSERDDRVRAQTQLWETALGELGFSVRHVHGIRGDELQPCNVVLVENISTRSRADVDALHAYASAGGHVVLHHHTLPWDPDAPDRSHDASLPRLPNSLHIAVSLRAARDLHARGYAPVVAIHDHFNFDAPEGDRAATRAALGFTDDDIVLYQPTAATRTTNVAGAIRYARALHAVIKNRPLRYWLRGPIEDDVARTVERLFEHCPVPYTVTDDVPARDAFAASDVVLIPSTWDGTGGAAVQAVIAQRPCVVGRFPVLGELQAIGLRFLELDEPVELVKFLARPDPRVAEVNLRRARLSFSATDLTANVAEALTSIGVPSAER